MKKKMHFQFTILLLPTVLFAASSFLHSLLLCGVSAVSIPLIIRLIPGLKRHANLWAFLMLTPVVVLLNDQIGDFILFRLLFQTDKFEFLNILLLMMLHLVLFSLEQLAYGFLIRLLFPRQYILKAKKVIPS